MTTRKEIHDEIVRQTGQEYYSLPLHGANPAQPVAEHVRPEVLEGTRRARMPTREDCCQGQGTCSGVCGFRWEAQRG